MADVTFEAIRKTYGKEVALRNFSLQISSGELVSILGPSGCGKTTALRILAGFTTPDSGRVNVAGVDFTVIPPQDRGFGMVFQSYSLFPNMTARQNIEFALRMRKVSGAYLRTKTDELLDLTNMGEHGGKFPHQLSGGQQQRVALARALAIEPQVLLLDEPLSALDAKVREQLRDEIRSLQQRVGITTLFVTHDQHEAMAISDRVAVMRKGEVVQLGDPRTLYREPVNAYVATFVGTTNAINTTSPAAGMWNVLGTRIAGPTGAAAVAYVRPEDIRVHADSAGSATVSGVAFFGSFVRVTVVDGAQVVVADMPVHLASALPIGERVRLEVLANRPLIEVFE